MRCRIERGPWAGSDVGFDEAGTGEALVLLAPFPLQRTVFAEHLPSFGALRRTFAIDVPGFGDTSPAPAGAFTMDALADLVAAFLDARRVQKATLLGVSMGGYVALAFAARHRARLNALVLCDTRATADSAEAKSARAGALAAIEQHGGPPYLDSSLPRLLSPRASRDTFLRARLHCEERAASLRAAIEGLRDRPDRSELVPTLACPTLVVVGAEDQVTPPSEMRGLAHAIDGAKLVEIPNAGHLACFEEPVAFAREVTAFLESLGVRVTEELS